jgi:hypothetical protein
VIDGCVGSSTHKVLAAIGHASQALRDKQESLNRSLTAKIGTITASVISSGASLQSKTRSNTDGAFEAVHQSLHAIDKAVAAATAEARGARSAADRVSSALSSVMARAMESAAHELRTATSHPGASTPAGAAPISRSSTTAFAKSLLRKSVTFDDQVRAVELEVEESSVARARAIADHGGSGITHEDEPSSSSAATAAKVHSLLEHSRTEPTAAALAVEVESASQSQASDVASVALRGQPDDSPAPLLPSKQDGVIGSLLGAAMAASQPEISASLATKALASAACRESARRAEVR